MDDILEFGAGVLIDGHAHPLVDEEAVGESEFAFSFSESDDGEILGRHMGTSVTLLAAVRHFARRLGVDPEPSALVEYRNRVGLKAYVRALLGPEGVGCILLDTGYPKNGLRLAKCEDVLGVCCKEVVRVEGIAESLLPRSRTADELIAGVGEALRQVDTGQVVALKTIAAYRCGLDLSAPTTGQVREAFDEERKRYESGGSVRLTRGPLISAVVLAALEVAREMRLPLQIHTGFGDRDLDLRSANATLLRPIFASARYRDVRFVLLHANYPFVREAALLAALYPNVYVDLSLAIPLTAHGGRRVVSALLEQAPYSKIMYGSDASVRPELFAWGAAVGKAAVASTLRELVGQGWLTREKAADCARRILAGNAAEVYGIEVPR
ncbi:MAG: amidohydrolase family protein [Planctomycetaceae bacterium]|nr:amidohydrolase family protein [Planctomycetaceae bacterium]